MCFAKLNVKHSEKLLLFIPDFSMVDITLRFVWRQP